MTLIAFRNTDDGSSNSLTVDPEEENEMMRVPSIQGRIYQTIHIGELTAEGLQITTLSCSK